MSAIETIINGLEQGQIIPYLGSAVLELVPGGSPVAASPEALVAELTAKVSVPFKVRKQLTGSAQFIENFKHRKTIVKLMDESFAASVPPTALQSYLATLGLPLIVSTWYDNSMENAMQGQSSWGIAQGLSQSEHFGEWYGWYHPDGSLASAADADSWKTLLYHPIGAISPAHNYLVSDSDYVEVLTEIDIQTPIPEKVKAIRSGRHFLFLGCSFKSQLERTFARQIMKRSSDKHWAVISGELSRNEKRFLEEQNITPIDMKLADFAELLLQKQPAVAA